jgi:hypothetical protein
MIQTINGASVKLYIGGVLYPNVRSINLTIDYGHRFVIDQTVWTVDTIDAISSDVLIHFALSRVNVSPRLDDIEGQISKIDYVSNSLENTIENAKYEITGPSSLIFGEVFVYSVKKYDSSGNLLASSFTFSLSNSFASIIDETPSPDFATVKAGNTLGLTTLTVKQGADTVLEKNIRIIGFQ